MISFNTFISLNDWDLLSDDEQSGILKYLSLVHGLDVNLSERGYRHTHIWACGEYLRYGSLVHKDDTFVSFDELKRVAKLGDLV